MSVLYEVVAMSGSYTDRTGKEKNRYVKLGVIMETKNGGMMLKCEAIPVGWNGMAFLNEPREYQGKGGGGSGSNGPPDDDIPY